MKGKIVNMLKKITLSLLLCVISSLPINAFLPCGNSSAGVLNVGFLPNNLPWSAWDSTTNSAIGFDPLLAEAVAKILGYDQVNFIGYGNDLLAFAALNAGTIDIYANSNTRVAVPGFIGVVTDISAIATFVGPLGWSVSLNCCEFASRLDAAITALVDNGTYAQVLQEVRANGWTNGFLLGFPADVTGVLEEPFPFASAETGTIPTLCPAGPISLPQPNCIAAFLQATLHTIHKFYGCHWSYNNVIPVIIKELFHE